MTLQIRSISIYSHHGKRRDIDFRLGSLNIVTGASKTGKSALLDIVEYCWGSRQCNVPEGKIRKYVSWFAVHFDNDREGILIARENPGPTGKTGGGIYFERGIEELPANDSWFHKNMTTDGLRMQLSAILGISENIHVPGPSSTRNPIEASSGHAILFCLQAQSEIANRKLLFHRQDEPFLPQAIRDVLPYFLGAVDERHLLVLKRYQDVRRRLRMLERDYNESQVIKQHSSTLKRRLTQEARRTGLIPQDAHSDDASRELALLREVTVPKPIEFSTVDDPSADLTDLEERRRTLLRQLRELNQEFAQVNQLDRDASKFAGEAREQEARLASIELISDVGEETTDSCPLCNNQLANPIPAVSEIRSSLAKVQTQLRSVRRDVPRLQGRLAELASRREELGEQLRDVNTDIQERIQDNERLRLEQHQFIEQARVAGRIGFYLDNIEAVEEDGPLLRKLKELRLEKEDLETTLDDQGTRDRLVGALSTVGHYLTSYSRQLDLEYGENSLRLDLNRLGVVADTNEGPLSLEQMGSAENWVGYHVAAHLGLHKFFRNRDRPVPGVLLLDQPSQAHYPPERDTDGRVDTVRDEDQAAVHQLFKLLYRYCKDHEPIMQIIVSDHVDLLEEWFSDSVIARWRDGDALIPHSWVDD